MCSKNILQAVTYLEIKPQAHILLIEESDKTIRNFLFELNKSSHKDFWGKKSVRRDLCTKYLYEKNAKSNYLNSSLKMGLNQTQRKETIRKGELHRTGNPTRDISKTNAAL